MSELEPQFFGATATTSLGFRRGGLFGKLIEETADSVFRFGIGHCTSKGGEIVFSRDWRSTARRQ